MRMAGLSAWVGSWYTMATLPPRHLRKASSLRVLTSWPSTSTRPLSSVPFAAR